MGQTKFLSCALVMKRLGQIGLGVMLFLLAICPLDAAGQISWDGDAADGLWSSPTNWSGDAVPGDDDDVEIIGNFAVTVSSTDSCKSLVLQASNSNNQSVSLTINAGARLGVREGVTLNDRNKENNGATVTVAGGSILVVGGNFTMTKDGGNKKNNDMQLLLQDDNSRAIIAGDLAMTFTSTNNNGNDMGLVLTEDSRVDANNLTATLNGNRESNTLISLNATGAAGDSAVLDVTNDVTITNSGGKQKAYIDMDYESRFNVGGSFTYTGTSGRAFELYMDRDAALHVTSNLTLNKAGDREFRLYMNQNADGSADHAQIVVGGAMTINLSNGDATEFLMGGHSDVLITGNLDFDVTNIDDDADDMFITLTDTAKLDVGGAFDLDMSNGKNVDLSIDISNGAEIETTGAFTIDLVNDATVDIDLLDNGILDVGTDFTFDNTTSSDDFELDMDNNSVMTVGGNMSIQQDDDSPLEIFIDRDASLSVTGDVTLTKTNNDKILVYLNQISDGSGADAQFTIGGNLIFTKTDGDETQIYLGNDADLNITGDLQATISNTDDDADYIRFDLDGDAGLSVGDSVKMSITDAKASDLDFILADNATFSCTQSMVFTHNGGSTNITCSGANTFSVGGNWYNTMTDASDYNLTFSSSADVDVTGDFHYTKSSGDNDFTLDMDNTATFDIGQDMRIVHNADAIEWFMDRDAAFSVGDSLLIQRTGGNENIQIYLNNTSDGSGADAQMNIPGNFVIDKNDADGTFIYTRQHADIFIGGDFDITSTNTDDDGDEITIDMENDSRITIGDSLKLDHNESTNPRFRILMDNKTDLIVSKAIQLTSNAGNMFVTMNDTTDLTVGEEWRTVLTNAGDFYITMNNAADIDVTGDFYYFKGAGTGEFVLDMDNVATFDTQQDLFIDHLSDGEIGIYLDRDAALTVADSIHLEHNNNDFVQVYLNQSADGSAADAQITVPGAFYIDKNDGDNLQIALSNDADINITGNFLIETANTDDNNDATTVTLNNESHLTIGGDWQVTKTETTNPAFNVTMNNSSVLALTGALNVNSNAGNVNYTLNNSADMNVGNGWTTTLTNGGSHYVNVNNSGDLDVTGDFNYTKASGTGEFVIDMDNTGTFDISQDLISEQGGDGETAIYLDADAALTITDSLYLQHNGNEFVRIHLNQTSDGSGSDGQLNVNYLHVEKNDGDDFQIALSNHADLNITNNLLLETANTDDDNDNTLIDLNNDSRLIIGGTFIVNMLDASNPAFNVRITEDADLQVTGQATWTQTGGDIDVTMGDNGDLVFGNNWYSILTTGNDFDLIMYGASDLDVTGDMDYLKSSGGGRFVIDMNGASTLDVSQDLIVDHNGDDRLEVALDSNAAMTIGDSMDLQFDGNGDFRLYLNQNTDGSTDAQLGVGYLILDKDDGDQAQLRLSQHSDLTVTHNLLWTGTGTDDADDNYNFSLANDAQLTVGGNLTVTLNESQSTNFNMDAFNRSVMNVTGDLDINITGGDDYSFDIENNASVTIGDDYTVNNSTSSGQAVIDLDGNASLNVTNDLLFTNQSTANDNTHTRITLDSNASLTVGDSLMLLHTNDNNCQILLNEDSDGDGTDAQLAVTGTVFMQTTNGDAFQIQLNNDADFTIGNDLVMTLVDTDGSDDAGRIQVDNDAVLDIEGSALITTTNDQTNENNDFIIDLNNSGRLDVGPSGGPFTSDSLHLTLNGGDDFRVLLENSAVLNVFGHLRLSKPGGDDILVDLGNTAQLNVSGNLTLDNSEDADEIRIDLESTAFMEVDGNITMTGATAENRLEIELNNTAELEMGGTFFRDSSPNNYGLLDMNDDSVIEFDGTGSQVFPEDAGAGTDEFEFQHVIINNTFGTSPQVTMEGLATIHQTLTLTDGVVESTSSNIIVLDDDATSSGGSADSHIDGFIRKVGNDAYTFPVGDGDVYLPIGISAPSDDADAFEAQFFRTDPDPSYSRSSKEVSLVSISQNEYWLLNRTAGSSAVNVTLSWNSNSGVDNTTDLRVARFDDGGDNEWKDHGNGGTTGDATAGTITTSSAVTNFSPFALASSTSNNPLPIELLSFDAHLNGDQVELKWETAVEINNDYFEVERSVDAQNWEVIVVRDGAGNSHQPLEYKDVDQNPYTGISYYRLSQVDFDGTRTSFNIVPVEITELGGEPGMRIFPNPLSNGQPLNVVLENLDGEEVLVVIRDLNGKEYYGKMVVVMEEEQLFAIDRLGQIPAGVYLVVASAKDQLYSRKLIVR